MRLLESRRRPAQGESSAARPAVQERPGSLPFVLIAALAIALAWLAREAQHRRVPLGDGSGWFTTDPDSLYQMRRVERVFHEGLPVAGEDPLLAWPEGSAIPWPPYYTLLCWSALAPFAPDAAAEGGERLHDWIERSVAQLPLFFGLLAVLAAALAGRSIAGNAGAWIAALYPAVCGVAIAYSKPGNGDHHAFVSLCSAVVLLLLTQALWGERLERRRTSLLLGAAAGVVSGVQLGAWVGALMYVVAVELVLGWLIVLHSRRPRAGLAWLGLGYHLAAGAVLLPAVIDSPWRAREAWMVINLSWFQPAFLLAGAAVFVPLLALRGRQVRPYPWIVLAVLALTGSALLATDAGPGRGLRAAVEWAAKENVFMARVRESRSLLDSDVEGALFDALGRGVLLLPVAWVAMAWMTFRRGRVELLPWVVSTALLALGAARQARLAEPLVIPMAVVLGWGGAQLLHLPWGGWLAGVAARAQRLPGPVLGAGVLAAVLAAHSENVARCWVRLRAGPLQPLQMDVPEHLAVRHMAEWLRARPRGGADPGVLSNWSWGHVIEWAGARPTVATNFGLYVGEDGFRDSSRFFLEEDPTLAEALLARRRAGHVLITSGLPDTLNSMFSAVDPALHARYVEERIGSGGALAPVWFRTMGARLMFDGQVFGPSGAGERPLDFLRLVFVSALRDPERTLTSPQDVSPAGWLWERVAGARLEAQGLPGRALQVRVVVQYPRAGRSLVWSDRALSTADGVARLRLPYATSEPNGEGRCVEATWSFDGRSGPLAVTESAVLEGETIVLP